VDTDFFEGHFQFVTDLQELNKNEFTILDSSWKSMFDRQRFLFLPVKVDTYKNAMCNSVIVFRGGRRHKLTTIENSKGKLK
jgi:hypothetical protein